MALNKKEEDLLLHDVKRLTMGVNLLAEEADADKRKYIASLLDEELKRIAGDIEDLIENGNGKKKTKKK